MKSTIVLTLAIFLGSAPSPDSQTISEISAGFLLLPGDNSRLLAAQDKPAVKTISIRESETVTPQVIDSTPTTR